MFLVSLLVLGMVASAFPRLSESEVPFDIVTPKPVAFDTEVGTFLSMSVTGCTTQPCAMTVATYYEISFRFRPVGSISNPTLVIELKDTFAHLPTFIFVKQIEGTFLSGREYTIYDEILTPSELRGLSGKVYVYLHDRMEFWVARRFNFNVVA